MRRFLVLAAALGMMFELHALRISADAGASDPMTLAAIGFVILAAFTVGEILSGLGLPKVTGYILAGVSLGPQVSNILSERVVGELGMFNTLALGLIATTAGLELDLGAIRKVSRTLAATVGAKLLLLPLFVGLPFVAIQTLHPFFPFAGWSAAVAMGLILAVLGIGTSPAIALAVVNDSGAQGRLSDLLLSIAVVKDLVVVISLAIAIAVARALVAPEADFEPAVLLHLGGELGASVLVGAVVGGLLILYIRYVQAEMLFSVLIMVLIVAEASQYLKLELLLVFIVSGFVVRNFSRYEHQLLDPLERIALPVFVLFFTTAGAGVDLRATLALLPLAATLVACRALAYFVAGRIGGRLGGESAAVSHNAWLTYLPQAGVTLGLVVIAAQAVPELRDPITKLGMALVALNLLVGPITMGLGLRRAGETASARAARTAAALQAELQPVAGPAVAAANRPGQGAAPADEPPPTPSAPRDAAPTAMADLAPATGRAPATPPPGLAPPALLLRALEPPALREPLLAMAETLEARIERFCAEVAQPRAAALRAEVELMLPAAADEDEALRHLRQALAAAGPAGGAAPWEPALLELLDDLLRGIQESPSHLDLTLDPALLRAQTADSLPVKLARGRERTLARLRRGPALRRGVPVRLAARIELDARLAEAVLTVAASAHRVEAELLDSLRRPAARDEATAQEERAARGRSLERWATLLRQDLLHALRTGLSGLVPILQRAGGPDLPLRALRYGAVEQRVRAARAALLPSGAAWRQRVAAQRDTLRATVQVRSSAKRVVHILDARARGPAALLRSTLLPEIGALREQLAALEPQPNAAPPSAEEIRALAQAVDQALAQGRSATLRRIRSRFHRSTPLGQLQSELKEIVHNAPDTLHVVAPHTPVALASQPEAVLLWELPFAQRVEVLLLDELVPRISTAQSPLAALVSSVEGRVRDAVNAATYGLGLAGEGGFETPEARAELVQESLRRVQRRLDQLERELEQALDDSERAVEKAQAQALEGLERCLGEEVQRSGTRVLSSMRAGRAALRRALAEGLVVLRQRSTRLRGAASRLGQQQSLRDLKLRSGHETLDAAGMRAYLSAAFPPVESLGLPAVYTRLLRPAPVADRRLFVARQTELATLARALLTPPSEPAPTTLLAGRQGSGRSSLLNALQLQTPAARTLRLDELLSTRRDTLRQVLATELGVAPSTAALAEALRQKPQILLLDDLERWITPDDRGLRALEALLELIGESSATSRWLVTMDEAARVLYDELLPLSQAFGRVLRLEPLSWRELLAVLQQRERLGGFTTEYRRRGWQRLHSLTLSRRAEGESYFRQLRQAAEGNLREAFVLHLRCLRSHDESQLEAGTPTRPQIPFLGQISDLGLAVLATLARYGPMQEPGLAALVGVPPRQLRTTTRFLTQAGLLEDDPSRGSQQLRVVPELHGTVLRELAHLQVWPEALA